MAQKKTGKEKTGKNAAAKAAKTKPRENVVKAAKTKAEKKSKAEQGSATKKAVSKAARPLAVVDADAKLTQEHALALAEAITEMVNEGAQNPVAFFVSADDSLGRELIQLQGGGMQDMDGLVPVVLDAPQLHRMAMLTIADEMIWRRGPEDE